MRDKYVEANPLWFGHLRGTFKIDSFYVSIRRMSCYYFVAAKETRCFSKVAASARTVPTSLNARKNLTCSILFGKISLSKRTFLGGGILKFTPLVMVMRFETSHNFILIAPAFGRSAKFAYVNVLVVVN